MTCAQKPESKDDSIARITTEEALGIEGSSAIVLVPNHMGSSILELL
jgi:hypothetical protein